MSGTKQDYIDYRVIKSNEIFEDVKLLAANKRWNSCVNRLYYSSFHMISALLYKYDLKSETYNGAKTQFNLHFIKTGKLELKFGKLYSNLFLWRQESDYSDFIDFDDETVVPLIDQVFEMNQAILKLVEF